MFEDHFNNVLAKVKKAIGLLRKHHNVLPKAKVITIYKPFIGLHLVHGDIEYDQAFNKLFSKSWDLFNITQA